MKESLQISQLTQEKQATRWFLGLFYCSFIIYSAFEKFLLAPWSVEVYNIYFFDFILYTVLLILVPISFYLMRINKPGLIKYILFISFMLITLLDEIWIYTHNDITYSSGSLVEIVIILFLPIFVNKKYFYFIFIGTSLKYLIMGSIVQFSSILTPLLLVILISMISYIILGRIISYVDSLKTSYDRQIEGIVKGVITTLELKDPYTRGHSERVAEYAMALATTTKKFNDDELRHFNYACLLHDIGKIYIPDSVLTKPGRLTDEEFDKVKMHPIVGAKAVEDMEGISDYVSVVLHHHERWDGNGYPDNLKGEETPILARITSIADAFDAMTSSRSYRAALPLEEAYARIINGKGTQFDPNLVESFIDVFPKWKEIHQKYSYQDSISKGEIQS